MRVRAGNPMGSSDRIATLGARLRLVEALEPLQLPRSASARRPVRHASPDELRPSSRPSLHPSQSQLPNERRERSLRAPNRREVQVVSRRAIRAVGHLYDPGAEQCGQRRVYDLQARLVVAVDVVRLLLRLVFRWRWAKLHNRRHFEVPQ